MSDRRIGIDISGTDPNEIISRIQKLEGQGIKADSLVKTRFEEVPAL